MTGSMRRKGNGWDRAPTESGCNSVKNAQGFGERCTTRDAMKGVASHDP
jgi:hypothetical protein